MSASLFADVIVDINDILRVLKAYEYNKTTSENVPTGLLFPIAAPAPQRPVADFATILLWQEPDRDRAVSDMEDAPVHKNAYLRSGGSYTQRLLTQARAVAKAYREDEYIRAQANPALANQAPPWPPAPELIANPPNWGLATIQSEVAPHLWDAPRSADMDATASGDDWSDASSQGDAGNPFFEAKGRGWDTESMSISSEDSSREDIGDLDDNACATGYFIGRDGTAWPMPPPECMPGGYLSSHPSPYERPGRWSPVTTDDSLSGYEACTSEDGDAGELREIEGWVVWSAEGAEGDSDSDSDEYGRYRDDRLNRTGRTTPPPLSYSVGNSPATSSASSPDHPSAPSTPTRHCCLSLADLGRQWYESFGKDLQPPESPSPCPCASPSRPRMPLASPSTAALDSRCRPRIEDAPRAGSTLRKMSDARYVANVVEGYVLGRNGSPWPLPPPPPDESDCTLRRGRIRVPKWW